MKYTYNTKIFFDEAALSYYLLGAFCSDGNIGRDCRKKTYINGAFSITSKDDDWLIAIGNLICPEKNLTKHKQCYKIKFNNIIMAQWLVDHGCVPAKSLILKMPDIPEEYFRDFVRGYFDGDGCISLYKYTKQKNNKTYIYDSCTGYICSGSKNFILSLKDRLDQLNLVGCFSKIHTDEAFGEKLHDPINHGWAYRLSFHDSSTIKFLEWLYYDESLVCLKRKQEVAKNCFLIWKMKHQAKIEKELNKPPPPVKKCKTCDIIIENKSEQCKACYYSTKPTKISWPNDSDLYQMVKSNGVTFIAKQLGVSYNAVRDKLNKAGVQIKNL
jgi:hypothetical protein